MRYPNWYVMGKSVSSQLDAVNVNVSLNSTPESGSALKNPGWGGALMTITTEDVVILFSKGIMHDKENVTDCPDDN